MMQDPKQRSKTQGKLKQEFRLPSKREPNRRTTEKAGKKDACYPKVPATKYGLVLMHFGRTSTVLKLVLRTGVIPRRNNMDIRLSLNVVEAAPEVAPLAHKI